MFCDLVGSTALSERLDPEDYRQIILDYQEVVEKVIQHYRGHIAQYLGDGLLIYFGYPQGLEDAAKAGVQAGLDILKRINHANWRWKSEGKTSIDIRIGIHTGLVVVDDHLALGATTNIASRLEGLAPINGLVISPQTLKVVQGWFEIKSTGKWDLKGIREPIEVFQVLGQSAFRTRLDIAKSRGLTPLVGREDEIRLIWTKWLQAKKGNGNLILLNGEAGIGKSRLSDTIKDDLSQESNIWITEVRCSSYHQNSAFFPIIELFTNTFLQFDQNDSNVDKISKIAAFLNHHKIDLESGIPLFAEFLTIASDYFTPLDISPLARKSRIIEALVQFWSGISHFQPILLIVEDLHWADASTLEWLNFFIDQIPNKAIFIICTTRPGFQAPWIKHSQVSQITIQRLSIEKVVRICNHYTRDKSLPGKIVEQIYAKTEGVPLFVEELIKMVLESDLLKETEMDFRLKGELNQLAIPSSLQDSLLARLDRLSMVKEVVQVGSVLGRQFSLALLRATVNEDEHFLNRSLDQLVEAEIFYRIEIGAEVRYQFKHALIQDAAYSSILKSNRQKLHARVATVLKESLPEIITGQPELVAYHFTMAGLHSKAIPFWLEAGLLASRKHATSEAMVHLKKGLELIANTEEIDRKSELELDFMLALGGVSTVFYGYTHPEVEKVFSRAKVIAQKIQVSPKLAFILYGLQTYYLLSEAYENLDELINYSLNIGADPEEGYLFNLFGTHILGVKELQQANFREANHQLKGVIDIYNSKIKIPYELTPGGDVRINASSWLSLSLQISGYSEQARQLSEQHLIQVDKYKDSRTLYHIYTWVAWRLCEAREWRDAAKIMETYIPIAQEFGDPFFILVSKSFYNMSTAYLGDMNALDNLNSLIRQAIEMGFTLSYIYMANLSELHCRFRNYERAISCIDEAWNHLNKTGSHWPISELCRIRALALEGQGEDDLIVEANLKKALELSRKQFAKTYELRAAKDLARLWMKNGALKKAAEVLEGVYYWFSEGLYTKDLQEARTVLDEINERLK